MSSGGWFRKNLRGCRDVSRGAPHTETLNPSILFLIFCLLCNRENYFCVMQPLLSAVHPSPKRAPSLFPGELPRNSKQFWNEILCMVIRLWPFVVCTSRGLITKSCRPVKQNDHLCLIIWKWVVGTQTRETKRCNSWSVVKPITPKLQKDKGNDTI